MSRGRGVALRLLLAGLGLFCAASAWAQAVVHERGEFRFSVGPVPAFVQPRAVPAQWGEASAPGERWRNWLLDRQVDRRGGGHVDYADRAYEALTPSLVDEAAKFSIDFSPLYQTLTIHRVEVRRGDAWGDRLDPAKISLARRESGFEENLSDGQVTALIVLEDVRVGDVVRVAYSIDGSNPILDGHIASSFLLGWVDPILVLQGRVLFDRGTPVAVKHRGSALAVAKAETAEGLEFSFAAQGVAAIRDEGSYPNWFSPFPRLEIARERSWAEIVAWAQPLYPEQAELPAELEARLLQWRRLPDAYQQAGAVLRLAQEEVRYFGVEMGDNTHQPHPPVTTWARRYGDCKDKAYLAVILLRRLGLDAVPALVSTRDGRAVADRLPAASAFNHVIVRLRIDGKDYWLDPTLDQQRGDLRQLDLFDYGVALPVAAGSSALVEVEAPEQVSNGIDIVERFVPAADGKTIELHVETRFSGDRAESARRRLHSRRFEQLASDFANYYRKRYGELAVASPTRVAEDEAANTLVYNEHYLLQGAWQESGGSLVLESYAEGLSRDAGLPPSMARTEPMELARPSSLRHEVRVELPPGWVLSTVPGRVAVSGAPVQYQRELSQDQRVVSLVHKLEVASDHVGAPQVGQYLARLREINDALGLRLAFGRPTELRNRDREQRLKNLLRDAIAPTTDKGE